MDTTNDEDSSSEQHGSQVFSTYRKLPARRVDLVGDYAGDALFLIEGDSLLLQCFTDDKLDFDPGFQILHAVYNVEHFLENLVRRRCHFRIVFFESNRNLCVPGSVDSAHASKYLLARATIIRHLQVNLGNLHPGCTVCEFESWDSPAFQQYVQATSPYFLMAHDGAGFYGRHAKDVGKDSVSFMPTDQRVALRGMILHFISHGLGVALVNGLELQDTRVMTVVLEGQRGAGSDIVAPTDSGKSDSRPVPNVSSDLMKLLGPDIDLSERQLLAVITVSKILRNTSPGPSTEELSTLCATFLLHQAYLIHLELSSRRLQSVTGDQTAHDFLQLFASTAETILSAPTWRETLSGRRIVCDVTDFVDGRLFLHLLQGNIAADPKAKHTFEQLAGASRILSSADQQLRTSPVSQTADKVEPNTSGNKPVSSQLSVLPFSNYVFDKHLESVRIKNDNSSAGGSLASRKVFQEVSHWHNAKKPLIQKGPPTPADLKQASRAAKRNQRFMAEMRNYSASLTNAMGRSLEPETIVVGTSRAAPALSNRGKVQTPNGSTSSANGPKPGSKNNVDGKTARKNVSKQARMNENESARAQKGEAVARGLIDSWKIGYNTLTSETDKYARYQKANDYNKRLKPDARKVVGAEVDLYLISCLVDLWTDLGQRKEQTQQFQVAALIWSHVCAIVQNGPLPKSIAASIESTVDACALPQIPDITTTATDRKPVFSFTVPPKTLSQRSAHSATDFTLLYCGPYLERSFDSRSDDRVDFQPDGWQRRVLDSIDADQSVFVVAPTSAGKTFISFYAMRKILQSDDDGVLVYVAPTKALVNQIAAEIQARYSKNFKHGGKSVWAIHTRDYRINSPTGCQVLVTVPHVLQIMLLSSSNANSWSKRVKRIIFDEIHSIGQAEDGVVWEQLLLMAPCPIIALSATVGNPGQFSSWLTATQAAIGNELVTVQHSHRYSDLRKYLYAPPERFKFQGIPSKAMSHTLGLEGLPGFKFIHPVAALVDRSHGIPEDLALEPRDCLYLWQAMVKVQTDKHPVSGDLAPEKSLPKFFRKVDVLKWEATLKHLLRAWLDDGTSPFEKLLIELNQSFHDESREPGYATAPNSSREGTLGASISEDNLAQTTLPLLCRLNEQSALPAILFNYDRTGCETVCRAIVTQLQDAETSQVKTGPKWQKKLEKWEQYKVLKARTASGAAKASQKIAKGKNKDDDDASRQSKSATERETADSESQKWDLFDPEAPVDGYSFADPTKLLASELEDYNEELSYRDVPQWLIQALARGVGVHHAGMNRRYRQIVEMLFRKGYLRVIVATGTLALGINMPCKTVVFSGDSVYLTALNYRQCAGRAGRRGFDLLGNVVFQGISRQKVCRLISSRLPDLNGHFPITTTLVLRLFTLLHDSKYSKYALNSINALLSQPRLYMGGPSFKDQAMHHLRFSIEYLRRQHLLGADGAPLNFAGLVSHLYFTENSSFAFHALLKEGFFHEVCAGLRTNEQDTLETLMLIMSHLFVRIFCRQADVEYVERVIKPSSSIVLLPPLPAKASKILAEHNQQTLRIFRAYVETFVNQHIHESDRRLPLTGMIVGAKDKAGIELTNSLPSTKIRSPFVALSGAGDDFDTIHDLCQTTRHGVFLEEAVIPHVGIDAQEMEAPLNAFLMDFYKHGDIATIERANGIRRSEIWFLLKDFSLILATIITSLQNFTKLTDLTDTEMMEATDDVDFSEPEDNEAASVIIPQELSQTSVTSAKPKKSKKVVKDSWDDEDDEDDEELDGESEAEETDPLGEDAAAWDGEGEEGLRHVLKAFQKLRQVFDGKFKAMWA
ncbi:P-loop containing nucleoside triphosphate hydrolase protein [Polychaeton citri CBS 116435]|uniref:P-loop containing nucleoside triphosphate hydrolase protein n=1 Tax=Polychaeton citri CBS 116435 TaxID=1314669 RepID=A0A9P4QC21_9PEZI|nr:P-loop containing nucleoside triphosphate hydrolase protein [Polychaeton citri CBS 116435]